MNFTIILISINTYMYIRFLKLYKNDHICLQSLKLKDIKVMLERTGHVYTKKNIRYSEAEVLRIVDYKVKF